MLRHGFAPYMIAFCLSVYRNDVLPTHTYNALQCNQTPKSYTYSDTQQRPFYVYKDCAVLKIYQFAFYTDTYPCFTWSDISLNYFVGKHHENQPNLPSDRHSNLPISLLSILLLLFIRQGFFRIIHNAFVNTLPIIPKSHRHL